LSQLSTGFWPPLLMAPEPSRKPAMSELVAPIEGPDEARSVVIMLPSSSPYVWLAPPRSIACGGSPWPGMTYRYATEFALGGPRVKEARPA
jgi:hypothetical protein